jgi:hypothetical protein
MQKSLSYDVLDPEALADATAYAAIHAFENTVRQLVTKAMAEVHGEEWCAHVPPRHTLPSVVSISSL